MPTTRKRWDSFTRKRTRIASVNRREDYGNNPPVAYGEKLMGRKILAWSNGLTQYTGYATCQKHLLPRINRQSDHEVIQLACSGMMNAPPTVIDDVQVYPHTEYGGKMGERDLEYVIRAEDVDLLWTQLDVWAVADALQNLAAEPEMPPIVVYAPIDHNGPEYMPAPVNWRVAFEAADVLIPYCEFGERVMQEQGVADDKLRDPILHGVDPDTFTPDSADNPFGVGEDAFVIGYFKNLQGTRGGHDRALRSFRQFLDIENAWDDAYMYMHCSRQGKDAYRLPTLINEFGLDSGNILLPSPAEYRWFTDDQRMASLYSACDVVLNTVRGEGFGLPVLEAMACETSVIAGAYSSMPELVLGEEGEITHEDADGPVIEAPRGWLVPTWDDQLTRGKHNYRRRYNPEHIVEALREAYHNPAAREEKGRNGREFAMQHPWTGKADQFITLFNQLEDVLWETDETIGVEWETIGSEGAEHGGVGGLGGGRRGGPTK